MTRFPGGPAHRTRRWSVTGVTLFATAMTLLLTPTLATAAPFTPRTSAPATAPRGSAITAPRLEERACPVPVPSGTPCGFLVVPERRGVQVSRELPGARFVEFAGVGHAVFLSSRCGRQTISAFVADPRAAAPCDPRQAPYRIWRQGEFHLTAAVYRVSTGAWWLLIPFALFFVTSAVQLVAGLTALTRRRPEGRVSSVVALTTVAGLAGVAFTLLAVVGVYRAAATNETALAVGVPTAVTWYGTLAALSALLSVVLLFRSRFRWPSIVAAGVAVTLLVWWFAFIESL
ncbi:hypothetical protein [Sphaerisporangium perillae]|uniref:hypothetical protein n=1 Tax=Sphaerisporangium perillae TaxID=2935860 RepID=UPI0020102421|nr:hypothetical protein [Sphaerisporangium perillae]